MKDYFGDNFYLEVQNHNVEIQKTYNKRMRKEEYDYEKHA